MCLFFFFFFQAEDGIRDVAVTGVQTCALPIFLFAVALGSSLAPVGDLPRELLLFAALAIIPEIGGHTLYNWEIGRASCRGRVEISVVAVSLKKKKNKEEKW